MEENVVMEIGQFVGVLIGALIIIILMGALLYISGFRLGGVESVDLSGETYFVAQ